MAITLQMENIYQLNATKLQEVAKQYIKIQMEMK